MFIAGGSELCDHTNMYLLLLNEMVFLSVWSSILCNSEVIPDALLNGSSVTYIPARIEPVAMTYLKIFDTSIQTLDLRQLLPYTSLYKLEIQSSPAKHVISAHLPLLSRLHLNSLNMVVPPALGPLCPQLEALELSYSTFTSIPDNYFKNFTLLKVLNLKKLGLTNIPETWMRDLNQIRVIYISEHPLGAMPHLHLWFPKLRAVYAKNIGLTFIPVALIKAMNSPATLKLTDNNISSIPQREDFEPIRKWKLIDLTGNDLHCVESLRWIKVRSKMPKKYLVCRFLLL